ncbi:MAG: chemotaxis protein CheD [Paracoccaceae bacterium]|jgi:chemotaxis protein CheD
MLSREDMILVIQGEYAVSDKPNVVISTLLGSCVSACLWDDKAHIGGLNHIVLSTEASGDSRSAYHGINAMEILINDLVKLGASRGRLQAKIFGGARMIKGLSDVGASNAAFVQSFLERDGIPCISKSVGGTSARKIQFWPTTGRARQMLVGAGDIREEVPVVRAPPPSDDVELF